jgi:hypothetical protein
VTVKCGLLFIPFFDIKPIIHIAKVQLCEYLYVAESIKEFTDQRQGVLVLDYDFV